MTDAWEIDPAYERYIGRWRPAGRDAVPAVAGRRPGQRMVRRGLRDGRPRPHRSPHGGSGPGGRHRTVAALRGGGSGRHGRSPLRRPVGHRRIHPRRGRRVRPRGVRARPQFRSPSDRRARRDAPSHANRRDGRRVRVGLRRGNADDSRILGRRPRTRREGREPRRGRPLPALPAQPLRDALSTAGLAAAEVHPLDVPTVFADFDDFWRPFLGGQGPAPGYCASLSAVRRDELRDLLDARSRRDEAGRIALTARAWAFRGTVSR